VAPNGLAPDKSGCGADNFQIKTKPIFAMLFAVRSFIISITRRVIQLSGQAEHACPDVFGREAPG
jgi:hypothetical protein